jgi:hypothetical protein
LRSRKLQTPEETDNNAASRILARKNVRRSQITRAGLQEK